MNIYTALPFIAISNLILGFVLGKYSERWAWNKMLRNPRPLKQNKEVILTTKKIIFVP